MQTITDYTKNFQPDSTPKFSSTLTEADYAALEKSYLTREIVDAARIRRVDTVDGAEIVGQKPTASKDYAGLVFHYLWPGEAHAREYRLRRDNPDLESRPDGSIKEKNKYLSPPGKGNLFYLPPGTPPEWLTDSTIPVTFTEGEKKALALWRFYCERGEKRLVIGLAGVFGWRGKVGYTTNGNGKKQAVTGPIPDWGRIEWQGRQALIVFDVNVLTNEDVAAARRELAREAQRRGAAPSWVDLPTGIDGVNGVDDLLARCGPEFLAGILSSVSTVTPSWESISEFDRYDLPDFPLDALPDFLRSYAKGLATATQTPVDLPAMLGLANCSAAIAGKVIVRVREDWHEPTNIYNVNALDVGERKTAVHDATKAPLEEVEGQLVRDAQLVIDAARVKHDILVARLEHLKKAAGKEDNAAEREKLIESAKKTSAELQEAKIPATPKLLAGGDITPEAIASNLADQDGRLFISSDEGELFNLLNGRYGNGPNFEIVLKAHAGSKVRVDRRGRSEVVGRATLTIAMTVQPDVLRGIAANPEFRARGLTARLLYTLPKSLVGRRNSTPEALNPEAVNQYSQHVKKLAALEKEKDKEGNSAPKVVDLSADARDYLTAFMDELEPQLAEGGALRPIADWANKLAGAVVRLAAILHYSEHDAPHAISEIPAKAIKDAIKIGRYLIQHAQAAYVEMGADPEIQDARKLLRWIEVGKSAADPRFTRREAHKANPTKFPKVTDLDPALNLLEAHGYIRALESKRRDSRVYEINPAIWQAREVKIDPLRQLDSLDSSLSISEAPLTNEATSVQTVQLSKGSDFAHTANGNGSQPGAPGRKRVSL